MAKSQAKLRLVKPTSDETDELQSLRAELAALKASTPAPKESGPEIAARIRSGMGPTRPLVVRCLTRAKDERWV